MPIPVPLSEIWGDTLGSSDMGVCWACPSAITGKSAAIIEFIVVPVRFFFNTWTRFLFSLLQIDVGSKGL